MKKTLKITALVLALLMLLPLAIACKKEEEAPEEETTDASAVSTEEGAKYDANGYLLDYIPDELDYGGQDVYVLGWSDEESGLDFFDGELTGEKISDAVFMRNTSVKSRLNVNIVYDLIPGNNKNKGEFAAAVTNNVASQSQPYDLIASYSMVPVSLATNGMLTDISTNQYLHFEAPWWNASLVEGCSLGDGLYFVSGDLAPSTVLQAMAMLVNMDQIENYQLEDPRTLVKSGDWTLEKLFEMAKKVPNNGNTADDTYAIGLYGSPGIDAFLVGSDISYIERNRTGKYGISDEFESEKTFDLMNLIISNMYTGNAISEHYAGDKAFKEKKLLINITTLSQVKIIKSELTMSYSIIPMPKYEYDGIEQESYKTVLGFPHTMFSVPVNAADVDLSSVLLECFASESYRQLRPEMYEALKYQNSNEAIDAEMFDLVIDGIVFDLGRIVHGVFDSATDNKWQASPIFLFRERITKNDPGFYSAIKSHKQTIDTRLESLNMMAAQS